MYTRKEVDAYLKEAASHYQGIGDDQAHAYCELQDRKIIGPRQEMKTSRDVYKLSDGAALVLEHYSGLAYTTMFDETLDGKYVREGFPLPLNQTKL